MTEPDVVPDALLALLDRTLTDLRAGRTVDLAAWHHGFPQHAAHLDKLLQTVHALETAVDDWRGAATLAENFKQILDEPLPSQIGRFRIDGILGSGGMGTVYRAHDPQLDRAVAVKVPHFDVPPSARVMAMQRFLREARVAARVRHAHVCPIHDVGEVDGRPYVVMAFIEGQSLRHLLKSGPLEPVRAADLVAKIALGLEAIHKEGIVHRDVKPANILIDTSGHPYLADFGLARPMNDKEPLTQQGQIVGTAGFIAPEQAQPQAGPIGPWTDVFSLGMVLYEALSGRLPFDGPGLQMLLQTSSRDAPPPSTYRASVSPHLDDLVLKAVARQPAARFQTAAEFSEALTSWIKMGPHGASPASQGWAGEGGLAVGQGDHSEDAPRARQAAATPAPSTPRQTIEVAGLPGGESVLVTVPGQATKVNVTVTETRGPKKSKKRRLVLQVSLVVSVLLGVGLVALWSSMRRPTVEQVIQQIDALVDADPPDFEKAWQQVQAAAILGPDAQRQARDRFFAHSGAHIDRIIAAKGFEEAAMHAARLEAVAPAEIAYVEEVSARWLADLRTRLQRREPQSLEEALAWSRLFPDKDARVLYPYIRQTLALRRDVDAAVAKATAVDAAFPGLDAVAHLKTEWAKASPKAPPVVALQSPHVDVMFTYRMAPSAPEINVKHSPVYLRPNTEHPVEMWITNLAKVKEGTLTDATVKLVRRDTGVVLAAQKLDKLAPRASAALSFAESKLPLIGPGAPPLELWLAAADRTLVKQDLRFALQHPERYLEINRASYDRLKNRLSFIVALNKNFIGPPCQVQLVVDRDYVPGLKAIRAKNLNQTLSQIGQGLELYADLVFDGLPSSDARVFLTVDGFERAFEFLPGFDTSGLVRAADYSSEIGVRFRTKAYPAVSEQKELNIALEIDARHIDWPARVELGFNRSEDNRDDDRFETIPPGGLPGLRNISLSINPDKTTGTLLCKMGVADWNITLPTAGLLGRHWLRVRVIDEAGKVRQAVSRQALKPLESDRGNLARLWLDRNEVFAALTLDDSGVEGIKFLALPELHKAGAPLEVKVVTAPRPETRFAPIDKAIFYFGKKSTGAIEGQEQVEGQLRDGVWTAVLRAPAEEGRHELAVQFLTRNQRRTAASTFVTVKGAKAEKPGPVPKNNAGPAPQGNAVVLKGDILDAAGRKIPNALVRLRDPKDTKGIIIAQTKSDTKGAYVFEKVRPGVYVLEAGAAIPPLYGVIEVTVPPNKDVVVLDISVKLK
jgi:hypothetical protein